MLIIGCDFHTRYQQIAMVDQATGELVERRLDHESGEAGVPHAPVCGAWVFRPLGIGPRLRRASRRLLSWASSSRSARFPGFTFNCKPSTLNRIL
jgi:hypothetical protein